MSALTIDPNVLRSSGEIGRAEGQPEFNDEVIAAINDHATLIDSLDTGAVQGSGTTNALARWTASDTLGDAGITDTGPGGQIAIQRWVNFTLSNNTNAYQFQCIMQGTNHVGEAVSVVGYVNTMTCDCTLTGSSVIGGQFQAAATRSLGANTINNIAVQGEAYTGTGVGAAYSFYSANGEIRNSGGMLIGTTSGTGVTIGSGSTAASNTLQINNAVVVDSTKSVTLGNNVQNFQLPGTSSSNPRINIGWGSAPSAQLATKNTDTAGSFCGLEVHCDTTVSANARGGLQIYRGAGGSAEVGGVNVAGGANHFATGSAANDIVFHSYDPSSAGRSICFASGSTPTVRAKITTAGVLQLASGANGIEWASGGPKQLAGTGSPEGVVTAPVGSQWMRTDGGAGTCLYVKESGAGNTGWVAK